MQYQGFSSALEIIKSKFEQDADLPSRSKMTAENIIELLGFCLNNTYFLFQEVFYEQTKGAAMGSPVSPIVANIYMEAFENRAISTALHPTRMWKRYVDDTFVIHQSHKKNSSGTSTQWTLPSSSLLRNPRRMVPSPFWTPS